MRGARSGTASQGKGARHNAPVLDHRVYRAAFLPALVTLFQNPGHRSGGSDIAYSQLLNDADQGRISNVVISGQEVSGTYTDGRPFTTYAPNDPMLVQKLAQKGVPINARPPSDNTPWFIALLVNWLPILVFIGAWVFLSRQMQSGAGRAMGFGKSKAKLLTEAHGRVTFEDVAGVDEAKEDLQEIVEFLRDIREGRIPRFGAADGHAAVAVIEAAYRSATTGQPVGVRRQASGFRDDEVTRQANGCWLIADGFVLTPDA